MSRFLLSRAPLVAAFAAALLIVPNHVAPASADEATARRPRAPQIAPGGVLRAPPPPPSTHPAMPRGYVPPSSTALKATSGDGSAAAVAAAPPSARTWGSTASSTSTLVLYDTTDEFGWLGELYAMAAGNLASHFGSITAEPIVDYEPGQVNSYTATIYIASTYNEPIPVSFLNDVMTTTRQVLWAGVNIWQMAGTVAAATAFQNRYGWDASTSFFNEVDTVTQVAYNGQTLTRNAAAGAILAPHITSTTGQVTVLGTAQCGTVSAPVACAPIAQTPVGATTFPWAIKSANLTYIGEVPLSFMNETDRYLAFSDLLFPLLQPGAPTLRQALVRFEDVSPGINTPEQLTAIADYLSSVNVPFSVAVIPAYADPNGFYNGGTPEHINISQTSNPTIAAFNDALRYMVSKGGTLIQHGYTHQYSNVANPYSGVSGDDFEFYRSQCATTQNPPYTFHAPCLDSDWIIQEGPLPGDSAAFAALRAAAGKALFAPAGLPTPTIWETPHYSASATDYAAFNTVYPIRYEREQFFGGQLTGNTANSSRVFGQFFPYVVNDVYGTTIIPESLANFEPEAVNHTPARLPAAIIANAQAELAVRQGVASFFFHPYYDITYLQEIVAGIQALGYTFVAPSAILSPPPLPAIVPASASILEGNSGTKTLNVPVALSNPSTQTVTAHWATIVTGAAGQADPATDYIAASGTVTFTPGQTSKTVPITIKGDILVEPNESIIVSFTNPTNATIGGIFGLGLGSITNDDQAIVVPGGASILEGNSGTKTLNVPVALSNPSTQTVTAHWATIVTGAAGQADPATDYIAASGTVTFTPGQTSKTVPITIRGDILVEPNESIIVSFTNPTNATIGGFLGLGLGSITNDDQAIIVPGGASILEGNSGTKTLNLPVALSNPSTQTVTAHWATIFTGAAGQADPATDYIAASGTVTFTPGQTSKTVPITIRGDILVEPNESIIVSFTNPTNATIGGFLGLGFGIITNDD